MPLSSLIMCNTVSTSCSWDVNITKWSIGYFFKKMVHGPEKAENHCFRPTINLLTIYYITHRNCLATGPLTTTGFRHVEAPRQPLCGGPQYLKEIFFKVKEVLLYYLLSLICKYVSISKFVHWTYLNDYTVWWMRDSIKFIKLVHD